MISSLTLRFGAFVGMFVVHMYCRSTAGHLCPGCESSNVETVKPCLLCASVRVETPKPLYPKAPTSEASSLFLLPCSWARSGELQAFCLEPTSSNTGGLTNYLNYFWGSLL